MEADRAKLRHRQEELALGKARDAPRHIAPDEARKRDAAPVETDGGQETRREPVQMRVMIRRHGDPTGPFLGPGDVSDLRKELADAALGLGDIRPPSDAERRPIDAHVEAPVGAQPHAGIEPSRIGEELALGQDGGAEILAQGLGNELIGAQGHEALLEPGPEIIRIGIGRDDDVIGAKRPRSGVDAPTRALAREATRAALREDARARAERCARKRAYRHAD